MHGSFTTSDVITYAYCYKRHIAGALREECSLNVLGYRLLAYLHDHIDGATASELASILFANPASITVCTKLLMSKGLIRRMGKRARLARFTITKQGIDISRDADLVIGHAYEDFVAYLPSDLKAITSISAAISNHATDEGNRILDGHYFAGFEILHAILHIERFLKEVTHSHGFEFSDFRVLLEIESQGASASPSSLAQSLLLAPSSISHTLNKLESRQLVSRASSAEDYRKHPVKLTEAGAEALGDVFNRIESILTSDAHASAAAERAAYKDAAMIIVSMLRKNNRYRGAHARNWAFSC